MRQLVHISLAFLALFAIDLIGDIWALGYKWRLPFVILSLIGAIVDFVVFCLIPFFLLSFVRKETVIAHLLACLAIAFYVFLAGMFYVSISGMQTLQLGQDFHIRDGQMMPAFYWAKLRLVLAIYLLVEAGVYIFERYRRSTRACGETTSA
ncbi:hypothetical protein GAO09_14315 [Rhizobiales bacterium RZME27]|uniref:Uncharacterized protein n=1 Tax=Endobacterium cereale TaxID=2663029 RepID=A0A6A8ABW4_9HYPH|nr:hypothetical protein [Endobacterium cereale]MEB2843251.1 hypothetical protein [Endobacterium cereale]MQY47210.1 hypothetical protein [Endobacterium cereale]